MPTLKKDKPSPLAIYVRDLLSPLWVLPKKTAVLLPEQFCKQIVYMCVTSRDNTSPLVPRRPREALRTTSGARTAEVPRLSHFTPWVPSSPRLSWRAHNTESPNSVFHERTVFAVHRPSPALHSGYALVLISEYSQGTGGSNTMSGICFLPSGCCPKRRQYCSQSNFASR
jgi:hypothetical protein